MKKTPLKRYKRLNPISDKQGKELDLRWKIKAQLILMYGYKCMTCGSRGDWRGITLSHKIPLSRGGETNRKNCILECYPCHEYYEKKPELRSEG